MPMTKPFMPPYRDDPLFLLKCHPPYSTNPSPNACAGVGDSRFSRLSRGSHGFGEQNTELIGDGENKSDFRQSPIDRGVEVQERHVFLCYKTPGVWPARIEAAEFDRLPRLLAATLSIRKRDMTRETRLAICEGHDGADSSNGDVLIFPDMIKYRSLTHFDVDAFIEDVLVKNGEWFPGNPEALSGWYIFVCCHGSRNPQCGICGPSVIQKFNKEIEMRDLQGQVSVKPCSHIEGHKYPGNVLVFGPNTENKVRGHWYGYVLPEDVPLLLDQHFGKGKIMSAQIGLSEDQKKLQDLTYTIDSASVTDGNGSVCASEVEGVDECMLQEIRGCLDSTEATSNFTVETKNPKKQVMPSNHDEVIDPGNICSIPNTWYGNWERDNTYVVLAVVFAVVSVVIACRASS